MLREGLTYDGIFDWDENAPIHRPLPMTFLLFAATEFQREHERQMKERQEHACLPEPREMFTFAWAV
jgi:casein kinase 1